MLAFIHRLITAIRNWINLPCPQCGRPYGEGADFCDTCAEFEETRQYFQP